MSEEKFQAELLRRLQSFESEQKKKTREAVNEVNTKKVRVEQGMRIT